MPSCRLLSIRYGGLVGWLRRGGMQDLAPAAGRGGDGPGVGDGAPGPATAPRSRPGRHRSTGGQATSASSSSSAPHRRGRLLLVRRSASDQEPARPSEAGLVPGAVRITAAAPPAPRPLGLVAATVAAISASAGPAAWRSVRRSVGSAPRGRRRRPGRRRPAASSRGPAGRRPRPEVARPLQGVDRLAHRDERARPPMRRSCCASSAPTSACVARAAREAHLRAERSSAADRSSSPLIRAMYERR